MKKYTFIFKYGFLKNITFTNQEDKEKINNLLKNYKFNKISNIEILNFIKNNLKDSNIIIEDFNNLKNYLL